jgi:hypothetical protein
MKLKVTLSDTVSMLDELLKEVDKHIQNESRTTTQNILKIGKDHIQQAIIVFETVVSDMREREMRDIQEGKVFKR